MYMETKTLLDRNLQATILKALAEKYPFDLDDIPAELRRWHPDFNVVYANLHYLKQHGLIDMKSQHFIGGNVGILALLATHKGMDFLLDDGGLSKILDVVTVKLHEDTLTALLQRRIEESNLTVEEKSTLSKKLSSLGEEGAKHLLTKALDYGLTQAPNAINWLSEAIKAM